MNTFAYRNKIYYLCPKKIVQFAKQELKIMHFYETNSKTLPVITKCR